MFPTTPAAFVNGYSASMATGMATSPPQARTTPAASNVTVMRPRRCEYSQACPTQTGSPSLFWSAYGYAASGVFSSVSSGEALLPSIECESPPMITSTPDSAPASISSMPRPTCERSTILVTPSAMSALMLNCAAFSSSESVVPADGFEDIIVLPLMSTPTTPTRSPPTVKTVEFWILPTRGEAAPGCTLAARTCVAAAQPAFVSAPCSSSMKAASVASPPSNSWLPSANASKHISAMAAASAAPLKSE
mmetsp:Transcript_15867/g.53459  ORF Transcript_15867/g.53459 Transcript_15867/m.53459 type:complete len:249 (+) Transcript_15867:980-1726(+)